ncbi:MAG: rhodanese-like domain-containing protein [Ferruginibacter sp.]
MKIAHKLISAAFLFFISFYCKSQTGTVLNVTEFEKGINKDSVQLLDVRTPAEYNGGHIKNALLADWKDENEFIRRIGFIDKEKPLYVYCLAGGRSAAAAAKMRAMGYRNVYELTGGINAWKAGNKALEGRSIEKQMSIAELDKAINTSKLVLVDFGAEWCPPCKKMEPVLKSLQNNNLNKFTLVKVDGGRDENILKKYNVTQLPVFILFKDGEQVWRKDGIAEEKEIANLFN